MKKIKIKIYFEDSDQKKKRKPGGPWIKPTFCADNAKKTASF